MTSISTNSDAEHDANPDNGRGKNADAPQPDLAARLKAHLRVLRARVESREALRDAVRNANASLDPQKIAEWLVAQAGDWMAAPCWAVVAHDTTGHLAVIADHGLTPSLGPSLWSAANWVMRHGDDFLSADQIGRAHV